MASRRLRIHTHSTRPAKAAQKGNLTDCTELLVTFNRKLTAIEYAGIISALNRALEQ
jgi:hypothetical protein